MDRVVFVFLFGVALWVAFFSLLGMGDALATKYGYVDQVRSHNIGLVMAMGVYVWMVAAAIAAIIWFVRSLFRPDSEVREMWRELGE